MTNPSKDLPPFIIALALLGFMALIMLAPSEAVFNKFVDDDFTLEYVDLTFKMGILFLVAYSMIKILKLQPLAGLSKQYPWRFKYLNIIPIYLFIIGILSVGSKDFSGVEADNVLLLLLACLVVGFAEEYLFRGLLQPLFLKKYALGQNGIFKSILFTSVFFGLFHLLNLAKNENVGQVLVQVVFATFIGFFFGVLLLKTNKLIPIAVTHGLINFFFSLAFLPGFSPPQEDMADSVSIAPIILFLPLLVMGLLISRKINKSEVINKLKIENN